jgi:hypothetical protein
LLRFDAYKLKWIAIIGMVLNHIVIGWWDIIPVWLALPMYASGGLTFPIIAHFVVEGYKYTSNLKRYILRLLIFGVIAIPFHTLTFGFVSLNIMFTIIVGILCILLYDKMKNRPLFWILFVIITLLTAIPVPFDWAVIGVIVILLTHTIKNENKRRIVPAVVAGLTMLVSTLLMLALHHSGVLDAEYFYQIELLAGYDETLMLVTNVFIIGCLAAAFLLKNYNGERGKRMKWLFYAFYPLHLAIIGIGALLLGFVDFSVFRF